MNETSKDSRPADPDKPHWIIRITPERHRERVTRIATLFGVLCTMAWHLAAFAGFLFGPLALLMWRPDAPTSQAVLWLRRVSGPDAFIAIYGLSMFAIIAIVFTGYEFVLQRMKSNPRKD